MTQALLPGTDRPAPDRAARLAALDIGTNSLRLIIADVSRTGTYRVIDDEKMITRLGRGSGVKGRLEPQALAESVAAIERLVAISRGFGVDRLRLVATAAVRDAENGQELVRAVRASTGETVDVISAEEEARLAHRAVSSAYDLSGTDAAIADIGGGSTEVVVCIQGVIEQVYTLKLGAARLKERFGPCDDPGGVQLAELRHHVRDVVREQVHEPANAPQIMIGTGGTFTTLAAISMARYPRPPQGAGALRGHEIQRDEVRHLTDLIARTPLAQRETITGLGPDRIDIIVPGLVIIDRLMKRLGLNRLRVHDRGIRDGVILRMIEEMGLARVGVRAGAHGGAGGNEPDSAGSADASGSAVEFAVRCGVLEAGARHTAALAASLYDQLAGLRMFAHNVFERSVLEHAAILRDVGYLVNYSGHHKHSYHLILHADLAGISHRERSLVAVVARYHRKSHPSVAHEEFAALPADDQAMVRRLAAVLRIADGLDRTHGQEVRSVVVESLGRGLRVLCRAERDPGVCLWGAERRADLFQDVFARGIEFIWAREEAPVGEHGPAAGAAP
jgi:exopolyphosphatase/guanosine-5'-triphosphate,3'-diphosphate pyrophosphatase